MSKPKIIKIDDQEYVRADEVNIEPKTNITCLEDLIGRKVFLRTVTFHFTGKVIGVFNNTLRLEDAAWIADSGRFADAIKTGNLDEVEPVGDWNVNYDTVVDWGFWNHDLPNEQK